MLEARDAAAERELAADRFQPAVIITGKDQFACAHTELAHGRRVILACADFAVFRQRFGGGFNATVNGRALAEMALFEAMCRGIRVNSAASLHSSVIYREDIPALLRQAGPVRKPWWRVW